MHVVNNKSNIRIFLSTCGIVYVWSLPYLAKIGFAEPGQHSISGFIANPPATGAMAAVSFMPLCLMWEFQDIVISQQQITVHHPKLYSSLVMYQFFYGSFLTCTENYAPDWLHATTVILFGCAFMFHNLMSSYYIYSNKYSSLALGIGLSAFISMIWVNGMAFWAVECIAMTSMILFTPIQWYGYHNKKIDNYEGLSDKIIITT